MQFLSALSRLYSLIQAAVCTQIVPLPLKAYRYAIAPVCGNVYTDMPALAVRASFGNAKPFQAGTFYSVQAIV